MRVSLKGSLASDDIAEALSQEQGVDRSAMRLAMRDALGHPLELLIEMGNDLWSTLGDIEPEVIADAEYRAGAPMTAKTTATGQSVRLRQFNAGDARA